MEPEVSVSACCSVDGCANTGNTPRYRRALWVALAINALMFVVEVVGGISAGSSALQADALDFLGDAANYGISLFVLTAALRLRAQASLVKGATMGLFGVWVIAHAIYQAVQQTVPEPIVMGVVGTLALAANVLVAAMLYTFRDGDSNMRSVWICSRNDAIGNIAVVLAASGVFTMNAGWPDVVVASIMGVLSMAGAWQIVRHARSELQSATPKTFPDESLTFVSVRRTTRAAQPE